MSGPAVWLRWLADWLARWGREPAPDPLDDCARGRHQGLGSRNLGRFGKDACERCGEVFDVRR